MAKLSRIVVALLVIAMAVSLLAGCGGSQPAQEKKAEKKVIKISIGLNDASPEYKGLAKWKELVDKESKGRLEIQIFPSAQLGDDIKTMTALRAGTLEMSGPSSSPISTIDKKWMVFDLPFLFASEKIVDSVLDGPFGQKMLDSLSANGLVGIMYMENGYRQLTNSKHAVKTPDDIKGLKIRTMENPVHLAAWRKLGANPTPMPFSEVFNAMQQKTIDGQENPNTTNFLQKFHEVQKYTTVSNHVYTPFVIMYSKKLWDALPKEDQELLKKTGKEASKWQREHNRKVDAEALEGLSKAGMTVTKLTPEQTKAFQDTTKDIAAQFENDIGKDILAEVKAEIAKVK
ncbi:ABC transporter substrate-binding protein [Anaerosporomusa subterranea]|uniref:ABC transporter substrate-binding protein n=1 Tax=Anaerosporomusa subterranea TaxID=1794912 RepID=A0A154BLS6_ANASB|nr:TRAP transporter substrate-binding protein [Anaerosporomusa subterranea]KYZ74790.1 ABC transporter substrate-binding protein [Anaerosporomusa subterranea]